jgi:hypothetical protein
MKIVSDFPAVQAADQAPDTRDLTSSQNFQITRSAITARKADCPDQGQPADFRDR